MSCPLPPITPPPLTGDETPNPDATPIPVGEAYYGEPQEGVTPYYPCMPDTATASVNDLPAILVLAALLLLIMVWYRVERK